MAQCADEKRLKTVQKPRIVSCKWENSFVEFLVAANHTLHYKMLRLRTDHVTIIKPTYRPYWEGLLARAT